MAASTPNKSQRFKPKNRKTKTFLVFDEKARSEYLRGFHKRKNEKKKLAREKHDRKILQERKELLKQIRETRRNHLREQAVVIPEIQHLVDPEVFDLPEHTVTIANIGDVDFVGSTGLRLGQNTGRSETSLSDAHEDSDDDNRQSRPIKNKSLQQKLAACTSQLSSQKMKAKKMKKKNTLKRKFWAKKKGHKKGKK